MSLHFFQKYIIKKSGHSEKNCNPLKHFSKAVLWSTWKKYKRFLTFCLLKLLLYIVIKNTHIHFTWVIVLWCTIYWKLQLSIYHLYGKQVGRLLWHDWILMFQETESIVSTWQYEKLLFSNSVSHFFLLVYVTYSSLLCNDLHFKSIQFSAWAIVTSWHSSGSCFNGWLSGQGGQIWSCFCTFASKRVLFRGMSS